LGLLVAEGIEFLPAKPQIIRQAATKLPI